MYSFQVRNELGIKISENSNPRTTSLSKLSRPKLWIIAQLLFTPHKSFHSYNNIVHNLRYTH